MKIKINVKEGILRTLDVAGWIWMAVVTLFAIFVLIGVADDFQAFFRVLIFYLFLAFGVPFIIKKAAKYILDGF